MNYYNKIRTKQVINMKQEWGKTQFVKISIDEIFAFQDKLDAVKNDPEKVWQVVDEFFWEAENQLELSPRFLRELQKIDLEEDSIPIEDADELLDNEDNYKKDKKYDIPFIPIHNF